MQPLSNCMPSDVVPAYTIRAKPIKIQWNSDLPVFAKEEFLSAVGNEYGWLGGIDESGTMRCFLPYTIIRKAGLRMVRFRVATIPCDASLDLLGEKCFLNSVVQHFRKSGADMIIPPSNNALFRTCPDGANPAPYGSYVIDLLQPEDVLWRNVAKSTRQGIGTARKDGVAIREGMEFLDRAYDLIRETFRRSKMGFMPRESFKRFALALGENGRLLMAEYQGVVHSCSLFAFSKPCAYWMYGGNIHNQHPGSMKLLQWEAIRLFRALGVRKCDYFGARINPQKGSKQDGINQMKKHLGATLSRGYVWKYSLRPWRAWVYSTAVRVLRGGDIVDQEQHKLENAAASVQADAV
jgi:Acetyltransferase (GNAT) domain